MASTSEQVVESLESGQSFIVEAGAGSGKTSTLVESLKYLLGTKASDFLEGNQQIVCITYTNVAANEILARIDRDPLVRVSTIHDFLWSVIRDFQSELREAISEANRKEVPRKQIDDLDLTDVEIEYWQYGRKWAEGKLHHDDIISLSEWIFSSYPKLARLVTDCYPIIFVDEYQDTHESTIRLLLDVLVEGYPDRLTVGLFGDYMQKIYETGVGEVRRPFLKTIQKKENYRCSHAVINLLNKLRPSLQQERGSANVEGSARFFYSLDGVSDPVGEMRSQLYSEGWDDESSKILMLTRKGIAGDLGWSELHSAYKGRGRFGIDDLMRRDDEFGQVFAEIEELSSAFADGRYGDFLALRASGSEPIRYHVDKRRAADQISRLDELRRNATVGDVLDFVWSEGLCGKPNRASLLERRIRTKADPEHSDRERQFLEDLRAVPFLQVISFERYLNKDTPFSTDHGVKGEEYENVLVVLDDTLWNMYKFESVLAGDDSAKQYDRSLNLFYVACSRACNNLTVLALSSLSDEAIAGADRLFGEENVAEFS